MMKFRFAGQQASGSRLEGIGKLCELCSGVFPELSSATAE